jgi:hypothetical protein
MASGTFLCQSANGKRVVFDPVHSHTATHFADAPQLRDLAIEALEKRALTAPIEAVEMDMGRVVGTMDVVDVTSADTLVYAMRSQREDQGWVPFTRYHKAKPCSLVSLYLKNIGDDTYELASAWIGEFDSPPFPQMAEATSESIPYWHTHAFVWGSQQIIPGTERPDCPW